MFQIPSQAVLSQIVFQPAEVHERAWLVYFNYSMLALACMDPDQADAVSNFRWNAHLALNDSRIFLEPSEVNIQAIMLLAFHGEDFASPSISWMLTGHACQQTKALALHRPDTKDPATYQQRLCLFWCIFIVDKSCALALGRPDFLPGVAHEDVPMPEFDYLLNFNPHGGKPSDDQLGRSTKSTFGAHVFMRNCELARLTALICDFPNLGKSVNEVEDIKGRLHAWDSFTSRVW